MLQMNSFQALLSASRRKITLRMRHFEILPTKLVLNVVTEEIQVDISSG